MTSNRPYLIRAIHEWIIDNGFTPHLVVDATSDDVVVPRQFVEDGRIVLNVAPSSVRELHISNDEVSFGARFSGTHFDVSLPIANILAIYARENGQGLAFADDEGDAPPPSEPEKPKGPSLRVVK
ncbi:MAG: ClpXP protease specificity-enhancing factor [Pseudomonadota bacterium]